jgi:hypothetical protein
VNFEVTRQHQQSDHCNAHSKTDLAVFLLFAGFIDERLSA